VNKHQQPAITSFVQNFVLDKPIPSALWDINDTNPSLWKFESDACGKCQKFKQHYILLRSISGSTFRQQSILEASSERYSNGH
jgi:hypothetical protein